MSIEVVFIEIKLEGDSFNLCCIEASVEWTHIANIFEGYGLKSAMFFHNTLGDILVHTLKLYSVSAVDNVIVLRWAKKGKACITDEEFSRQQSERILQFKDFHVKTFANFFPNWTKLS